MTSAASAFAALHDVQREGGGLIQIALLRTEDVHELAAAARAGDNEHRSILRVVADIAELLDAQTTATPTAPSCLLCDTRFWCKRRPAVLVVIRGDVPNASAMFVSAICPTCLATRPRHALQQATLSGLRERFGISIRLLPVFHAAGHA